jgi:hypothetical protein
MRLARYAACRLLIGFVSRAGSRLKTPTFLLRVSSLAKVQRRSNYGSSSVDQPLTRCRIIGSDVSFATDV